MSKYLGRTLPLKSRKRPVKLFLYEGSIMKKLLGLALAVASIGTVGLASEAKANEAANNSVTVATYANAQWQRDRHGRRIYNRRRTVRRTRVVRVGRRLYRETYLVSYLPNGRVLDTRLISRVRIS